jgi:DNA modification methylase
MAAENSARACCGVELHPLYIDVIVRRFEARAGTAAILADTGDTFTRRKERGRAL